MKGKHLFILPRGSYRGANQAEVTATIDGLIEMGLCKLPYDDDVYIQMSAMDCFKRIPDDRAAIMDRHNPEVWVVIGPLGNNPQTELKIVAINTVTRYQLNLFETKTDPGELLMLAESAANLLITLLATRNVVKSTKENKLAKLGIGGKKSLLKRFEYTTTISIPADLDDHESVKPGGAKCPHLRRGHIRRQHYGPGNQLVKKIWVAPVFVNADPDFVDQRAAYNVSVAS
jgi:hypothetical protein